MSCVLAGAASLALFQSKFHYPSFHLALDPFLTQNRLGDFIELIMAAHVFCLLWGISVVKWNLIKRMLINILVDFLIGLVPILGDLIDAYFKCNTRNVMIVEVELLEKFGPKSDEEKLHSVLGEPIGEPNDDLDEKPSRQSMGITEPRRPQHAHTGDNRGVGRWFSKGERASDPEKGRSHR